MTVKPFPAYIYAAADLVGVAGAAHTFLTIENPVGSGVAIVMPFVYIGAYAAGAAAVAASMRIHIGGVTSGGTEVPASDTIVLQPSFPARKAVIRTGGPTVTPSQLLIAAPPPFATGAGASTTQALRLEANSVTGTYLLKPGESFLFRTLDGDIDQRWSFTIAWVELS